MLSGDLDIPTLDDFERPGDDDGTATTLVPSTDDTVATDDTLDGESSPSDESIPADPAEDCYGENDADGRGGVLRRARGRR